MCDKSRNTWLCVHGQWNTLEWCQLNALQASPVVHLVTPLSCVSLSMNTQPSVPAIKATTTKAHRSLNLLRRNLSGCSCETKDKAYNTMVRPILEYAGAVWDPYQSNHIDMLEKVQRKLSRSICLQRLQQVLHLSGMMSTLGWRSLQEIYASQAGWACFTRHITIRRHAPSHHTSRWPNPEQGQVMTSNIYHLRSTWTLANLAFFPRCVKVWNILPSSIVSSSSVNAFKSSLQRSFTCGQIYMVPPRDFRQRPRLGSTSCVAALGPSTNPPSHTRTVHNPLF